MSEFIEKQNLFWKKMDDSLFWETIKPSKYIRTPCYTITHCDKVGDVFIGDRIVEILWDYVKRCVLIQDSSTWYHLSHTIIQNLTVRQTINGIVPNEYIETEDDVLDMLVHKAPLFKVRVLDLDDVDMCEKL